MVFESHPLVHANTRPLTSKERWGLFFFGLQFILSKFGIFLFFLCLNILPRVFENSCAPNKRGRFAESSIPNKAQIVSIDSKEPTLKGFQQQRFDQNAPHETGKNQRGVFFFIQMYCILSTIVTLFLNPQQTKYFGGLAVSLKQAGFFLTYGKSEKIVYIFSWVFIGVFLSSSYYCSGQASMDSSMLLSRPNSI